jgi:sirohydrochlorin cobaltochelatase
VLEVLSKEFLSPKKGINVLAAHGTEVSCDTANITYLGLDWLLERDYSNVVLASVEGVPDAESALERAKKYPKKRVRFIPLMYVAGDHVMNDIMGEDPEEPSWRQEVKKAGKRVDCVTTVIEGQTYYKGLGLYPEINEIFIRSIKRMLKIVEAY